MKKKSLLNRKTAFKWQPFSDKQLKIMTWWCETSPVKDYDGIIADGAVRSGKTVSMACSFIQWAMKSFNGHDFALCGKTVGSLRRNVLNTLKQQLPSLGFEFEDRRSDNLLIVADSETVNYFYIFGGKDESSQDLIQGMTLAGVLFDEVALMPQSFVAQAEARCSVEGAKLWYNCNPKGPTHFFKTEYIDKAKEKHLIYIHFTMDDNLTLSEKVKERYKRAFTGVFYQRNILGLWVTAEGKIYISFSRENNVISVDEWYGKDSAGKYNHPMRLRIKICAAGVDFGGSGSSSAFTCSAYTHNYRETVIVKEKRIKEAVDPTQLTDMFVEWVKECLKEYPQLSVVYCDSAEQVLIRGLKKAVITHKLPVAVKNARKGEIIDRIRFGMSMFAQHQFFILSDCKETISAYEDAVWDDKHPDTRLDDGTTNIDNLDSAEYSQEPFMKIMIDTTGG